MKKIAALTTLIFLCLPLAVEAGPQAGKRFGASDRSFVPGYVVVKFREDASEREREKARWLVLGRKGRRLKRTHLEKLHLPPGWDEERAVEVLRQDPAVQSVQVDPRVELLGVPQLLGVMPRIVPDDGQLDQQWYLDSPPVSGKFVTNSNPINVDPDIDAPEAWAVMAGIFDSSMTAAVGVIDSGCGELGFFSTSAGYIPGHLDLPNSVLFANTTELPADGTDSGDLNSFVDDANGWDFADPDNTPADDDPTQEFHGTIISGIIGAQWNNGQGIAGIGRGRLEVLPLRFIDSFFDVIAAVEYAIDLVEEGHAVRVLNMSFKSDNGIDPVGLFEVVEMAQSYGVAVAAAAGNDNGNNNDDFLSRVWPAEYTKDPAISNVLSVAATNESGALAGFSNIGPNSVQIAAPGQNIYSTYSGANGYGTADGTSFSTPIAGAVLGLVMAAHPVLLPADAIDRVVQGGDFDARLAGLVQSGKRVNLAGALAPFYPYSGLAYLDTTQTISMYSDPISSSYGTIQNAAIDLAWSTTPAAADLVVSGASTLTLVPLAPGIAQYTLTFGGAAAPVGTYDTGPWRVTAIKPFTAQVRLNDSVSFSSLLTGNVSWAVTDTTVATINSSGVLTGRSEGLTRVILSVDGQERDYSGWVLVQSSSAFSKGSNGGGCCGNTAPPGDPYLPGLMELMLISTMLLMMRRMYRTVNVGSKKHHEQG